MSVARHSCRLSALTSDLTRTSASMRASWRWECTTPRAQSRSGCRRTTVCSSMRRTCNDALGGAVALLIGAGVHHPPWTFLAVRHGPRAAAQPVPTAEPPMSGRLTEGPSNDPRRRRLCTSTRSISALPSSFSGPRCRVWSSPGSTSTRRGHHKPSIERSNDGSGSSSGRSTQEPAQAAHRQLGRQQVGSDLTDSDEEVRRPRIDEGALADADGRHGFVAAGDLADRCGRRRVPPDVDLLGHQTRSFEGAA